ncbi:Receptor like protein kinase S.3 [Acorus gramineus]|uniref:Receptor like protein kinase S.3 n=1 Tax=Acorus gramineus TaxID=55184 RepID=A0AAV9AJ18_ACOGR|nr:Receptor like protein kinase S.3 [Acorus gramineus]
MGEEKEGLDGSSRPYASFSNTYLAFCKAKEYTKRIEKKSSQMTPLSTPKRSRVQPATDVYAFSVFLLEVACSHRLMNLRASPVDLSFSDWMLDQWRRGALDVWLEGDYAVEEVELVLKLGLLCANAVAVARPSMR